MFYLSGYFKKIKLGVGITGAGISTFGVIFGAITLNPGLSVISSIFLLQSAFLIGEGTKVMGDVQKYVDGLKSENESLVENLNDLERISQNQQTEVKRLSDNVKTLRIYRDDYLRLKTEFERILEENGRLTSNIIHIQEKIKKNQLRHEAEVKQLHQENISLNKTREDLKAQVLKLKELHENSKALIKNLVMAGDAFTQFYNEFGEASTKLKDTSSDLDETSEDLQETVQILKGIVSRLAPSKV